MMRVEKKSGVTKSVQESVEAIDLSGLLSERDRVKFKEVLLVPGKISSEEMEDRT
jgi:hypothetical protein